MKRGRWVGAVAVAMLAFAGGGLIATAVLLGPMGLRVPSRAAAIATPTSIATPAVAAQSPAAGAKPAGGASLAFDEATSTVVALDQSGETWTWDGTSWTQRHPTQSPPGRQSAAMTYDPDHHLLLLWGGFDSTSQIARADFWSWDGTNWAFIHRASSPPADENSGPFPAPVLAYDSQRHLVVLVRNNGFHPAGPRAPDVWTWDGSAWSQAAGANVPRIWGSATYDPAVTGILFFGVDGNMAPQTWRFGAGAWTKLNSVLAPAFPLDDPPPMTYFGPTSTAELVDGSGQIWEWKGGDWVLHAGSAVSEPLRTYSTAFDSAHGQLVLLAASTYTWDGNTWTRAH